MSELYKSPRGQWVTPTKAKRLIRHMSRRLHLLGDHSAAYFIDSGWRRVAARPATWLKLNQRLQTREDLR